MDVNVKAFWLPKDGNSEAEYEDAYFPRHSERRKGKHLRFAVADGATESSFSGLWARLLVSAFVRRGINFTFAPDELRPLRDKWKRSFEGKSLAWYAEEKLACGAFAALIGLEVIEDDSGGEVKKTWRVVASGDSCLVQVRDRKIIAAFPLEHSASFTNRPDLLSSLPNKETSQSGTMLNTEGIWCGSDTFFLMTDALACWFFKAKEANRQPWDVLLNLDTQIFFQTWIASLRLSNAIKNDDVTLLRIHLAG